MAYFIDLTQDAFVGITAEDAEELLTTKQDKLVSGRNIKTINGESLLVEDGDTDVIIISSEDN